MIPTLRKQFNAGFTPEKYQTFLRRIDDACGTHVSFRLSETPCFFPKSLLDRMARDGEELIRQLVESPEYRARSEASIPAEFRVPNEPAHPMFVQVDFGLVRDARGDLQPKLVELQAFPSLYAYQVTLAQSYIDVYGLDRAAASGSRLRASGTAPLNYFLSGLDETSYRDLLRRAIVGTHDPENVILMEIHPQEQKTLPDFLLTEKMLGIKTVDIEAIKKDGARLYYERGGKRVPIRRIYNRAIVDELQRKQVKLAFDWRDDLDVEWAGHPNWYFRISKFSIPYLQHPSLPRTCFLDQLPAFPEDHENYLLKPLYSFAGSGIKFAPTPSDIEAIPPDQRHNYILQERLQFEPVIATPHGMTQMEIRMMFVWPEGGRLTPVLPLVRMGRGIMMGVDHNKNLEWVGGSAALLG